MLSAGEVLGSAESCLLEHPSGRGGLRPSPSAGVSCLVQRVNGLLPDLRWPDIRVDGPARSRCEGGSRVGRQVGGVGAPSVFLASARPSRCCRRQRSCIGVPLLGATRDSRGSVAGGFDLSVVGRPGRQAIRRRLFRWICMRVGPGSARAQADFETA
jgi:hypothetical protein